MGKKVRSEAFFSKSYRCQKNDYEEWLEVWMARKVILLLSDGSSSK